jgi:hypothetical protein
MEDALNLGKQVHPDPMHQLTFIVALLLAVGNTSVTDGVIEYKIIQELNALRWLTERVPEGISRRSVAETILNAASRAPRRTRIIVVVSSGIWN